MSDGGEVGDYAEVWVEANRSRARALTRYFSTAGAAFFQRWIDGGRKGADRAKSGPSSGWRSQKGPFTQAAVDSDQGSPRTAQ